VGTASTILADGFFGDKNFFTYQFEKLRTYLSLESDFPKRSEQHKMYVACRSTDGKVIAVCDIDNRPFLIKRPYMCNLAVCRKWRNQGLAKALVAKCEEQVLEWDHTELHLKARQINGAAVSLYKSLGYEVESEAFDMEYMDHLVVMRKSITRQAKYQGDASEKEAVFGAAERSLSSRS
jgi:GNAT superfamily N-acetyltransferase